MERRRRGRRNGLGAFVRSERPLEFAAWPTGALERARGRCGKSGGGATPPLALSQEGRGAPLLSSSLKPKRQLLDPHNQPRAPRKTIWGERGADQEQHTPQLSLFLLLLLRTSLALLARARTQRPGEIARAGASLDGPPSALRARPRVLTAFLKGASRLSPALFQRESFSPFRPREPPRTNPPRDPLATQGRD